MPIHLNGKPFSNKGSAPQPPKAAEQVDATDSARALAADFGIDLSAVEGTGAGGRVIKSDIEALITSE